jgi:hypothetical protein
MAMGQHTVFVRPLSPPEHPSQAGVRAAFLPVWFIRMRSGQNTAWCVDSIHPWCAIPVVSALRIQSIGKRAHGYLAVKQPISMVKCRSLYGLRRDSDFADQGAMSD